MLDGCANPNLGYEFNKHMHLCRSEDVLSADDKEEGRNNFVHFPIGLVK